MCHRGKPANTATVVTYTLGFTAAALTAGLAYFYAKQALRKIEQQARVQEVDVPPGIPQADISARQPKAENGVAYQDSSDEPQHSGEPILLEQHNSDAAPGSPSLSDDNSPSQRRALLPRAPLTADIESGSK